MPSNGYFDEPQVHNHHNNNNNNAQYQNQAIFANPPSSHCIPPQEHKNNNNNRNLLTPNSNYPNVFSPHMSQNGNQSPYSNNSNNNNNPNFQNYNTGLNPYPHDNNSPNNTRPINISNNNNNNNQQFSTNSAFSSVQNSNYQNNHNNWNMPEQPLIPEHRIINDIQNNHFNHHPSSLPYDSGTAEDESPNTYEESHNILALDEDVDHYLNGFRVNQCQAFLQHKCNKHKPFTCFDWHFKNQRRRKPVLLENGDFNYSPDVYCTVYSETSGECPNGDECPFLHRNTGDTERRYHLRYYKTQICNIETDEKTGNCIKNGSHCAYAHGSRQLRRPVYSAGGDVGIVPKLDPSALSGNISGDSTPPFENLPAPKTTTSTFDTLFQQIPSDRELQQVSQTTDLLPMSDQNMSDQQKSLFNQQKEICREKIIPDDPRWADANFVQIHYKTEKCTKPPRLCRQGYACPYYHNPRDRRRSPKSFDYTSTACPNVKMGMDWKDPNNCADGDNCAFCHTRTEQQFHHDIYKSNKCNDMQQSGYCPRGNFCAFAHVINTSRNSVASLSKGDSFGSNLVGQQQGKVHPNTQAMRNRIQSDSNLLRNSGMFRKIKSPSNDLAEQMSALGKSTDRASPTDSPPFRSKSIGQQSAIGIKSRLASLQIKKMTSCSEIKVDLADDNSASHSSLTSQPRMIKTSIKPIPESTRPPSLSEIKNSNFRNTISGGSVNNITGSTDFDLAVGRSPNTNSIFDKQDDNTTSSNNIVADDFGFSESFKGLEPDKALKPIKPPPLDRGWSVQNNLMFPSTSNSMNQSVIEEPELERMFKDLKIKYACLQQQYDNLKVQNQKKSGTTLPTSAELHNLPKRELIQIRSQLQNTTSEIDKILYSTNLETSEAVGFDRNNNRSPQSNNSQQLGSSD